MRIALVSLQFEETATGGGGVHVKKITDEYLEMGHVVTVVSIHTSRTEGRSSRAGEVRTAGDEVYGFSLQERERLSVVRFFIEDGLATPYVGEKVAEMRRILRFADAVVAWVQENQSRFDVVHLHGHHLLPGAIARELKPLALRVVSTLHFLESTLGIEHHDMPAELFADMRRWESMAIYADGVVIISPGMRENFAELLRSHPEQWEDQASIEDAMRRVVLISSGVETGSILEEDQVRRKLQAPHEPLRVVTYSRLVPNKGAAFSLKALPLLATENDCPVELVVAGIPDEGYQEVLEAEARALGDRASVTLRFFDRIFSAGERNQFMDGFDLYLFPTLREPFGITVLEAAARGLMVITTDADGPRYLLEKGQVVEKSWGYLSDIGIYAKRTEDPDTHFARNLAGALDWVLRNWDAAAARMLRFHQEIRRRHTWRAIAEQYLEFYSG